MRRKLNPIRLALAAAVAMVAVTAAKAHADGPKELLLSTNPFTGHVYCVTVGSGCVVHES